MLFVLLRIPPVRLLTVSDDFEEEGSAVNADGGIVGIRECRVEVHWKRVDLLGHKSQSERDTVRCHLGSHHINGKPDKKYPGGYNTIGSAGADKGLGRLGTLGEPEGSEFGGLMFDFVKARVTTGLDGSLADHNQFSKNQATQLSTILGRENCRAEHSIFLKLRSRAIA